VWVWTPLPFRIKMPIKDKAQAGSVVPLSTSKRRAPSVTARAEGVLNMMRTNTLGALVTIGQANAIGGRPTKLSVVSNAGAARPTAQRVA
jgi:hypothetical protein